MIEEILSSVPFFVLRGTILFITYFIFLIQIYTYSGNGNANLCTMGFQSSYFKYIVDTSSSRLGIQYCE